MSRTSYLSFLYVTSFSCDIYMTFLPYTTFKTIFKLNQICYIDIILTTKFAEFIVVVFSFHWLDKNTRCLALCLFNNDKNQQFKFDQIAQHLKGQVTFSICHNAHWQIPVFALAIKLKQTRWPIALTFYAWFLSHTRTVYVQFISNYLTNTIIQVQYYYHWWSHVCKWIPQH